MTPVRELCEVLERRRVGAYHALTLLAPRIAGQARPGQFVHLLAGEDRSFPLRRPFSIHRAERPGGSGGPPGWSPGGMGGSGGPPGWSPGGPGVRAALAVIPAGGGNDAARSLGLPADDPLAAAGMLTRLRRRPADLATVDGRAYLNVAGAGFDSEVNRLANQRLRWARGRPRYVGAVLAEL